MPRALEKRAQRKGVFPARGVNDVHHEQSILLSTLQAAAMAPGSELLAV